MIKTRADLDGASERRDALLLKVRSQKIAGQCDLAFLSAATAAAVCCSEAGQSELAVFASVPGIFWTDAVAGLEGHRLARIAQHLTRAGEKAVPAGTAGVWVER